MEHHGAFFISSPHFDYYNTILYWIFIEMVQSQFAKKGLQGVDGLRVDHTNSQFNC